MRNKYLKISILRHWPSENETPEENRFNFALKLQNLQFLVIKLDVDLRGKEETRIAFQHPDHEWPLSCKEKTRYP